MRNIRWVVLAILIFGSFVAYVLRTNVSIVSESMMRDLSMNEYQLGLVFSAFGAGYAIFQFPGGVFGDRFGPRFTITAIAIAWGLLTIVTALIPGTDIWSVGYIVAALVVTRFLVGAVHAPFFPVTIGGTIANWFPVRQWGLANGLTSTGVTLGAAATAPIVVWLMSEYGWRNSLMVTAPVAFIFAALFYWYVTNDPARHPQLSKEELALIKSDRPPEEEVPTKGAWKLALKDKNVLLLATSYACMNYVFYIFFNWFFFYLVDVKGFSAADAGMLTAAMWVIGAVGATAGGFGCDLLVRRMGMRYGPRALTMAALSVAAVFLYLGAVSDNIVVAIAALCISFGSIQLTEASFWVATMAVSGKHAAVATGVLNTGGNIPGIVGSLMVPVIAGLFGWPAAIISGSVFAIIAAILWIFVRADQPMG